MNQSNKSDLKRFCIKLAAVTFAVIIIINVTYNLIFAEKLETLEKILSINDKENKKNKGGARGHEEKISKFMSNDNEPSNKDTFNLFAWFNPNLKNDEISYIILYIYSIIACRLQSGLGQSIRP